MPTTKPHPRRVALFVDTSCSSHSNLLLGVARYLRERPEWAVHFEPRWREGPPLDALRGWCGDGVLAQVSSRKHALALQATGLPVIDLSGALRDSPFPAVLADNPALAALAFDHLRQRDAIHFACCGPTPGQHWHLSQRGEAFCRLVDEAGFSCAVYSFPKKPKRWEQEQAHLADWLNRQPKPLGVFACTDGHSYQVLAACRRIGLLVPQDVAVLGVDDDPVLCNLSWLPMSSIRIDYEPAGYLAASWLDRLMDGQPPPPQPILYPPGALVIRGSTDTVAFDDPTMNRVLRFIRDHACEGIQVRDLPSVAHLSLSELERRFRKYLHRTPKAELLRVQIEEAKRLLCESNLPLKIIAHRVGFSSEQYFSDAFLHHCGVRPLAYRRLHGENH